MCVGPRKKGERRSVLDRNVGRIVTVTQWDASARKHMIQQIRSVWCDIEASGLGREPCRISAALVLFELRNHYYYYVRSGLHYELRSYVER